jgi:regulatory protein
MGKIKIKYELKLKGVSEYNIKKGLTIISDNDYSATLLKLATAKWKLLKTEQYIHREINNQLFNAERIRASTYKSYYTIA